MATVFNLGLNLGLPKALAGVGNDGLVTRAYPVVDKRYGFAYVGEKL